MDLKKKSNEKNSQNEDIKNLWNSFIKKFYK